MKKTLSVKSLKIYFYTFILCITALTATAVPTVSDSEFVNLHSSHQGIDLSLSTSAITVLPEHELTNIGRKFLQPPKSTLGSKTTGLPTSRSLPNAPAAALLGLVGFLCVTGVKDRKEWLTALATLIWLTQAGITALPDFISNYQEKKYTKHSPCVERACAYLFENSSRLRSEVEGSKYASLLHHLSSIPDRHSSATSNINISQPAILSERDTLSLHIHCTAVKSAQFTCFSPAFIFSNLSRGPPVDA